MIERSYTYNEYKTIEILELLNIHRNHILNCSGYDEDDYTYICANWALDQVQEALEESTDLNPLMLMECMSDVWSGWASEAKGEKSKHMFTTAATMAYYVYEYMLNEWWRLQ